METETMGRVTVEALVENMEDLWASRRGMIRADQVRRILIPDALVDTGATKFSLPTRLIRQLGLERKSTKWVMSSAGPRETGVYEVIRLTIQGRDCPIDVVEVPDGVPALIGQIPLEHLDFVVDPVGRRLIGNPAHGGEQMYELY